MPVHFDHFKEVTSAAVGSLTNTDLSEDVGL